MHRFIILADDIYTLDTPSERAEARVAMAEVGIESLPIFEGDAGEEGAETGETLNAAKSLEDCDYPNRGSYTLADWLRVLLDSDSDEDMRAQVLEQIASLGSVHAKSFEEAMILTDDDGLTITTRDGAVYQITVVRAR